MNLEPLDPHSVFSNQNNVNLEDLKIYVDLTVTKRNRLGSSGSDKPLVISFIGNKNGKEFTTDWTDNKENFGIKSIDIKITSAYVPQVDIVFEDIRGQSLFNNFENSPYKVIFDMPPPIFDLTVKGYYGKPVKYRLHMLSHNTKFVNNNSFEIRANFVGLTFAPLSDIFIDYLKVSPYLSKESTSDINFLELSTKALTLENNIKRLTINDVEVVNETSYKNDELDKLKDNFIGKYMDELKSVVSDYKNNSLIRINRDLVNPNRVIVKYKYNPRETDVNLKFPDTPTYERLYNTIINRSNFLKGYKIPFKEDITNLKPRSSVLVATDGLEVKRVDYYQIYTIDLDNIDNHIKDVIKNNNKIINNKTNDIKNNSDMEVQRILNGRVDLERIMKIIMTDASRFFKRLKSVAKLAEESRKGNDDTSHGDPLKYAFPSYYVPEKTGNGKVKNVLRIPEDESFPEVQFVNEYINAKIEVEKFERLYSSMEFDSESGAEYKYLPINVFDSILDSGNGGDSNVFLTTTVNSLSVSNDFNTVNVDKILEVLVKRGIIVTNMSSPVLYSELDDFNSETQAYNDVIKQYAKLDAKNLITSLKMNEKLLDAVTNKVVPYSFKFQDLNIEVLNELKNNTLTQITGLNNNIIYKLGTNFKIRNADDFKPYLGIPVLKEDISISDSELVELNKLYKKTREDILNKVPLIGGEVKNGYLCQYNIPFYNDFKYGNDGKFNNMSVWLSNYFDYFPEIFKFKDDVKISSKIGKPTEFLDMLFFNRTGMLSGGLQLPFSSPYFMGHGIVEVPRFVLVAWGYHYINRNTLATSSEILQWEKIDINIRNTFVSFYNDFVSKYNKLNNISDYYRSLVNVETSDDKSFDVLRDTFFSNDFMEYFLEIHYISCGDGFVFNYILQGDLKFMKWGVYYDNYFNTLKREIIHLQSEAKKEIIKEKGAVIAKFNNIDLKTELYYNFKSFVDRWVFNTPLEIDNLLGLSSGDVLENFLLVDRGFNYIGDDVMVDLSPITSSEATSYTNLYTFLLNFLTKNNFNFFALPSFIPYNNIEANAEMIFGTHDDVENIVTTPRFICMYVGGTSSQLDITLPIGNSHGDDSANITDIEDLNNVKAFKVDFGTTNQSFFTNLELDQMEFKETNESIQMLDEIAKQGDNVIRGTDNSLFNVYQQRSYTASMNMMGNMMIQPTMYFNLTNIAMFKGTYLILEVNHSISKNRVTTFFKGVRIPKVSKPYVRVSEIYKNVDGLTINSNGNTNTPLSIGSSRITSGDIKDIRQALNFLGKIKTNNISNEYKALLDVISYAEGTLGWGANNGYDCLVGFRKIPNWNESYQLGHGLDGWYYRPADSTAGGRYQILKGTWLVNNSNPKFNKDNQDIAGVRLINGRLNPKGLLVSNINENNFVFYTDALAPEWASFPYYKVKPKPIPQNVKWTPGAGFYNGQGGKYSKEELWLVYTIALKKYKGIDTTENDLLNLVAKINSKNGDSNGKKKGVISKLSDKYGVLQPVHTNMTSSDRNIDINKEFISKYIINWTVPSDIRNKIPVLPSSIEINKDLKTPIENVLRKLIDNGAYSEITSFDGCFNIRNQRSSNVTSVHAYAMAVDFNANKNPFGGKTMFSDKFLNTFRSEGWICGADFGRGREDGMHYEYTKYV